MSRLTFWNDWPRTQKRLFQTLLALFCAAVFTWLLCSIWSSRLVIQWETISKISTLDLLLQSWEYGSVPMDLKVDQYLITQIFEGSDLELVHWPALILLSVIGLCLVIGLSLAVDLGRFWFLVSQVAFIFMMVGFKLEQLLLFNRTDKVALILAFLLFLPASYYFHALKKDTPLSLRLATFTVITMVFAAIIYFYSGVSHPYLYLVNYGIPIPIALTVIFIVFTGHEIIYGFLVLITRNNTPESSHSFVHFFTLSLIFLVNVLLLYLKNTRRIDWDFYYLDAFWILLAAAIIGIWGLRQRGELFRNIIQVEPHALTGYMILAIISFTTIGYFFATANDPAIEALEDIIVFSQLSIGFLFLIYILFNFRTVLIENLKVYKVVYKPKKMPFFSMRLGGFIGALGLFLLANQYPLDQAITAYYNGIGDLHRIDGLPLLAKEYYKLAAIYAKTNHRSNYAIASMEKKDQDLSEALAYFKQSTIKQPTPFAYVNTARAYEEQGMFFKAMFALKDGIEQFPREAHIFNNLSVLYAKTDLLDSAYYFLEDLNGGKRVSGVIQTNKLAILTHAGLEASVDSLQNLIPNQYSEAGSNLLVLANNQNYQLDLEPAAISDSLLNPVTFAWLYNYHLNQRYRADTQRMPVEKELMKISGNELYRDQWQFAHAVRQYYSGDIRQAFLSLGELQYRNSSKAGLYNDILGQWSLQNGQARLAFEYFDRSANSGYLPGYRHRSLALLALGNAEEAVRSWNTFRYRSRDTTTSEMSELMVFSRLDGPAWDTLTDQQKVWYMFFGSRQSSLSTKLNMLNDIRDPVQYQLAEQWLWDQALDSRSITILEALLQPGQNQLREIQYAVTTEDYTALNELLSDPEGADHSIDPWLLLGRALLSQGQEARELADQYYHRLTKNPFFEPGILNAVLHYDNMPGDDEFRAYNVLLDALEVNEYSVRLLKAYGIQCTRLNLDTYRKSTLETLKGLLTVDEYHDYLRELGEVERSMEHEFES